MTAAVVATDVSSNDQFSSNPFSTRQRSTNKAITAIDTKFLPLYWTESSKVSRNPFSAVDRIQRFIPFSTIKESGTVSALPTSQNAEYKGIWGGPERSSDASLTSSSSSRQFRQRDTNLLVPDLLPTIEPLGPQKSSVTHPHLSCRTASDLDEKDQNLAWRVVNEFKSKLHLNTRDVNQWPHSLQDYSRQPTLSQNSGRSLTPGSLRSDANDTDNAYNNFRTATTRIVDQPGLKSSRDKANFTADFVHDFLYSDSNQPQGGIVSYSAYNLYTEHHNPPALYDHVQAASRQPNDSHAMHISDVNTRMYNNGPEQICGQHACQQLHDCVRSSWPQFHDYQRSYTGPYSTGQFFRQENIGLIRPYSTSNQCIAQNDLPSSLSRRDNKTHYRSPVLEQFHLTHKSRKWRLCEIRNHVVEFAGDQLGSRFIQNLLDSSDNEGKAQVFAEILTNARQLMTDLFGNYVIQKLLEHGSQTQKTQLFYVMRGHVFSLSSQAYGCRVVQMAFEKISTEQQVELLQELRGENGVITRGVMVDMNGNHVVQKVIECVPPEKTQFIVDSCREHVKTLAIHTYGCRVIQRILEHSLPSQKRVILDELLRDLGSLIQDPFGNYVIQHVITRGEPQDRRIVVDEINKDLLENVQHKFASNVVEKALEKATEEQRIYMLRTLTSKNAFGKSAAAELLEHAYGNYVIQKCAYYLTGNALLNVIQEMELYLEKLRRVSHGKQVSALQKTIHEARRRVDFGNCARHVWR